MLQNDATFYLSLSPPPPQPFVLFLNATKRNRPTIYFLLPYILHFTLIIGIHASRASPPMSSAEIDNENIVGCKNYVRIIHFK